jgi:hypothetical protein
MATVNSSDAMSFGRIEIGLGKRWHPTRGGQVRVEPVRSLDGWAGDARLVRAEDGRYFVVSRADTPDAGSEVLVFEADEEGNVNSLDEVVGGRGMSHEQAIAELAAGLDRGAGGLSNGAVADVSANRRSGHSSSSTELSRIAILSPRPHA